MAGLSGTVLAVLCRGTDADRALCVAAAEAGADVALGTVSPADEFRVASIANEIWSIGTRQFVMPLDATDPTAIAAFAARTFDELGGCRLALASTWLESNAPFPQLSADEWLPVLSANLTIPYLFIGAFSKAMGTRSEGRIIVVAPANPAADTAERAARAGLLTLVADANSVLSPQGIAVTVLEDEPVTALG
ncbi:MAG: SDR family NAD(P)-dependent oxidoreductase [Dehalococcoidia bacterium]|nr:SDR family NAD(P)-dependent oxidoreductase [Dehalococcoidia bacterium]